jgi:uncharacterized protein
MSVECPLQFRNLPVCARTRRGTVNTKFHIGGKFHGTPNATEFTRFIPNSKRPSSLPNPTPNKNLPKGIDFPFRIVYNEPIKQTGSLWIHPGLDNQEGLMENLWQIPLILGVGAFAGFLNAVAGGGSLLTMPVLRFLGLSGTMANGTNRVAIFVQNASGVLGFRRKGISDFRYSILLTLPACAGALVGVIFANKISDLVFDRVLAGIMIAVLGITLFSPTRKLQGGSENLNRNRKIIAMTVFFGVGLYGGFIQAGVGFIIIGALTTINGFDLVRTNAIKLFVVFFYTIIALFVFIQNGNVDWLLGLTLSIGNASGAWFGSHWAVDKGEKWIKVVLVVTVLAFAIRLFWQSLGN